MSDPFVILACICFALALYGFGFMQGARYEHRRWVKNLNRLARMKKEGLL